MIPKKLLRLVLERDFEQCVIDAPGCLIEASTAHHRANRGMGGSKTLDSPMNLVACCGTCNGRVEDSHGEERDRYVRDGLRVRSAGTSQATLRAAQLTPVRYPDGRSFWLTADGRRVEVSGPPPF